MADYSARIELLISGLDRLKALEKRISALQRETEKLSKPIPKAGTAALAEVIEEAAVAQKGLNGQTERGLLRQIKLNAAVRLYERRLAAVGRTAAASQKQFAGDLEQIQDAFEVFKGKGSVQGVQAVATELGRIIEYSREVTRLDVGRVKSSQQIKAFAAEINQLKAAGLNVSKAEKTLEKFSVNAGTNKFKLAERYRIVLNDRLTQLRNELRLEQQIANQQKQKAASRRQQVIGAGSNALIGAGFPLLFGQGAAAAVGGGLGGLAGGLIGGPAGFALSIVGTAIGQAIGEAEKFNQELAALNARTLQFGESAVVTAKDVNQLAKNLGVAKDEALKLFGEFGGFDDAQGSKALAFMFGGDSAIFQSLVAAKDEASLAQVILGSYQKIGAEKASQLIDQIKLGDQVAVELAFQQALLEVEAEKTKQRLRQVRIQDQIIAGLANIATFEFGGELIDPKIFGEQRVAEFERDNPLPDLFRLAKPLIQQARELQTKAGGFKPDKAAKDAEREANRVAEQLRLRELNTLQLRKQLELGDKIFAAEQAKDPILARKLRAEQELVSLGIQTAQLIAKEKDERVKIAISQEAQLKADRILQKSAQDQQALLNQRAQTFKNTIRDLDYELAIKNAVTEQDRERLRIELEMAKLREQNIYSEEQLLAIQTRKQELAGRTEGADLIRQQIGALEDEMTKVLDPGQQLISLAESIGSSFSNSFKGLISGAMSAQEALANFFRSTADFFLDMATQIISKMLQMAILNSVLGLFPGAGGGGGGGGTFNMPTGIGDSYTSLLGFADGGRPPVGKASVVGEKGPELFVPGTAGTIVPNSALGGGTANIVVNVDASGTNVGGDQDEAKRLGQAVAVAVQQELVRQKRPGGLLA